MLSPVEDGLWTSILAGGAEEKMQAAKQIADLKKNAPEVAQSLIRQLPPEEVQQIDIISGIAELPLPPERIDGIARERIEKLPDVETMPSIIGEDDTPEIFHTIDRSSMVWDNGKWRPETEADRQARKPQPMPDLIPGVWENGEWRPFTPDEMPEGGLVELMKSAAVNRSATADAGTGSVGGDEIDGLGGCAESGGGGAAVPDAPAGGGNN